MQEVIWLDLGGVNAYLLKNDDKYLLVDTGGHMFMDKEYTDRHEILLEKLAANGVNKNNLKALVLTHGDIDHVNNVTLIRKNYGAPILMNEKDEPLVLRPKWDVYKENSRFRSFPLRIVFRLMNGKIEKLMRKVYNDYHDFKANYYLSEGDTLIRYGFDATILELPGHTHGSIGILDRDGNLIAGDLIANNKKPELSPNGIDFDQMRQSAMRIRKENVKKVFPGHGKPFEISSFGN